MVAADDRRLAALVETGTAMAGPVVIGAWPVPPPEAAFLPAPE
jgi:hypothetical protein